MPKLIFYFEKLRAWDKITIALYLVVTVITIVYYWNAGSSARKETLWMYPFLTQLFLYIFNYKSLRNLTVYCLWIVIAIGHFGMYLYLLDYIEQRHLTGYAVTGLRNTLLLLLLFQVLRFISAKTQGQELVCPDKSGIDMYDHRKVTAIDCILFVVYLLAAIFLSDLF
jgi:hypothetical protein